MAREGLSTDQAIELMAAKRRIKQLETELAVAIDLSDRQLQLLTRELAEWADIVVTMGCGDQCPYGAGKRYVDWDLADPKGRPIDEVRATRDEIAERAEQLVAELDASRATSTPVACSLAAQDLTDRAVAWRRLLDKSLVSADRVDGGIRLTVVPGSAESLRKLVDLEAECCPWIASHVDGATATLTAEGDGETVLLEMFAGLRGGT